MASRNVMVWLFAAFWAISLNQAESSGPDLCKDFKRLAAAGEWVDHSVDIPGEQAPNNKLALRVRCQETISLERYFDACEAKLTDKVQQFKAGPTKHSFAGKSGNWHALLCPQRVEPKVVPTFAAEVCKKKKPAAECTPSKGSKDKMTVAFKCNDGKTEIASCKADGQAEWTKAGAEPAYFGGKSGKLNTIQCAAHDPPVIITNYASDICNGDLKDEIDVRNGNGPITVIFECNEQKDSIVKCFPYKKNKSNEVAAEHQPGFALEVDFDKAVMSGKRKKITCWATAKPEIRKVVPVKATYTPPVPYEDGAVRVDK